MSDAARAHIEKAHDRLRVARLLLRENEAEDCINRAYYAIFHAAHAALAQVGESPKTHKGTQARFWTRFVETGQFPQAVGQLFSRAQSARHRADYEAFTIYDTSAAADLLRDAQAFVEEAEALLDDLPHDA